MSVRWSLYGVSMVVVCSHLAAHGHMNHERIASYNNILEVLITFAIFLIIICKSY